MSVFTEEEQERIREYDETYVLSLWEPRERYAKGGRKPIISRGQGCYLYDVDGNKYLDFTSQHINVNVGFGNQKIVEAIIRQVKELPYVSHSHYVVPQEVMLAKKLAELAPKGLSKSFFSVSGSDAVETALKLARKYTKRFKVVSLWRGYHGSTYGALSVTGMPKNRSGYDPFLPGSLHVPPPYCYRCFFDLKYPDCGLKCARFVEKTIKHEDPESVAAFIAEPVIGFGGVIVPPREYWSIIREICAKYGIVLVADEILTGFGRTGKMFAVEHYDVVPDIIVCGKGMSSGYLPISATIVSEDIGRYFSEKAAGHNTTYSGHALCCAAAIACLQVIEEERVVENSANVGSYFLEQLNEHLTYHECVGDIRGMGLIEGVELVADKKGKVLLISEEMRERRDFGLLVHEECMKRGVIVRASAGILRLAPPLCITKKEIDAAVGILDAVLAIIDAELPR